MRIKKTRQINTSRKDGLADKRITAPAVDTGGGIRRRNARSTNSHPHAPLDGTGQAKKHRVSGLSAYHLRGSRDCPREMGGRDHPPEWT